MRILGIDFGDSRTGYAVSDPLGFGVTPLSAYKEKNMRKVAEYTAKLAQEYNAELLAFPKIWMARSVSEEKRHRTL